MKKNISDQGKDKFSFKNNVELLNEMVGIYFN